MSWCMRAIFSGATCIWVIAHTLHLGGLPPCHLLNISLFALLDIEAEKPRGRNKKIGWGGDGGAHSQQPLGKTGLHFISPASWALRPGLTNHTLEKRTWTNTNMSATDSCTNCVLWEYSHSSEYWFHILMSNLNTCKSEVFEQYFLLWGLAVFFIKYVQFKKEKNLV